MDAKERTVRLQSPGVRAPGMACPALSKANPEAEAAKCTGQGYSSLRRSPFPSPDGRRCCEAESSFPAESPALGAASVITSDAHWTGCRSLLKSRGGQGPGDILLIERRGMAPLVLSPAEIVHRPGQTEAKDFQICNEWQIHIAGSQSPAGL